MKDYDLENLAFEDEKSALEYFGDRARSKNIFQGNKKTKRKNDRSFSLPLFASKH